LGVLGCLLILLQAEYGEKAANFEKIGDVSPDKKFAVRISCSGEPAVRNQLKEKGAVQGVGAL
jgi:hypothetical protein